MLWGKPVEISIKYDGENTTLYADGTVHSRSVDSKKHWSRDALTSIWKAQWKYALPYGWGIIVENLTAVYLTAVHSIEYEPLNSLYPCIAIIDGKGMVHSSLDKEACKQLDCELLAEVGSLLSQRTAIHTHKRKYIQNATLMRSCWTTR